MARDPLVLQGAPLSLEELDRYSRHLLLPDVGVEGQRRLRNARVLCVGAGGLGSPALLYLAAAGIGTIGIVDADVVDTSNLQRQVAHGVADVGRRKTDSAADAVVRLNPLVRVVRHDVALRSDNALAILAGYDLVLDGTDNFPTRYLLNDACALLGIPDVWASIHQFDGQVSIWWPGGEGPCYRCIFPEPPPPGAVRSCAEAGVLGALCGVIGSVQAAEVVKLVVGAGDALVGRLMLHDALRQTWDTLPVRRDPGCALCGEQPSITALVDYEAFCGISVHPAAAVGGGGGAGAVTAAGEISAQDLGALLRAAAPGTLHTVLVDVRSAAERSIASIHGAIAVEMDEFRSGAALSVVPVGRPVVLYCASGMRSADAAEVLRAAGRTDVRSLRGGMQAWLRDGDAHATRR